MKICLPTENWNDVFGFLSRPQLAELVSQIGDWYFASKAQFYLHECGQITMGRLYIQMSANGTGPVIVKKYQQREFALADVPMPKNIKNFKAIIVKNYHELVLRFLEKFRENFQPINLTLYDPENLNLNSLIMNKIMPMCTTVDQLAIRGQNILAHIQNDYSRLAEPVLKSARLLNAYYNSRDSWYCNWLKVPKQDGKPKLLALYYITTMVNDRSIAPLVEHLKKDFMLAQQGVNYGVKLFWFEDVARIEACTLDNGQTNERLVIKGTRADLSISRYPIGSNEEWIEEMTGWGCNGFNKLFSEYRNIFINF